MHSITTSILYMYLNLLRIRRLFGLAGGSSVTQLVADHMSFSDAKLTDVAPLPI